MGCQQWRPFVFKVRREPLESVYKVGSFEKQKIQMTKLKKQTCQPGLVNSNDPNFNTQAVF